MREPRILTSNSAVSAYEKAQCSLVTALLMLDDPLPVAVVKKAENKHFDGTHQQVFLGLIAYERVCHRLKWTTDLPMHCHSDK